MCPDTRPGIGHVKLSVPMPLHGCMDRIDSVGGKQNPYSVEPLSENDLKLHIGQTHREL